MTEFCYLDNLIIFIAVPSAMFLWRGIIKALSFIDRYKSCSLPCLLNTAPLFLIISNNLFLFTSTSCYFRLINFIFVNLLYQKNLISTRVFLRVKLRLYLYHRLSSNSKKVLLKKRLLINIFYFIIRTL